MAALRYLMAVAAACALLGAGCRVSVQDPPEPGAPRPTRCVSMPTREATVGAVTPNAAPQVELAATVSSIPTPLEPMPPREQAEPIASAEWSAPSVEGDSRTFLVADLAAPGYRSVRASLQHAGMHLMMWVEDGVEVDTTALESSARTIDQRALPVLAGLFGTAGCTKEPIAVLNLRTTGASGYYAVTVTGATQGPSEVVSVNLADVQPGTERYESVVTHELQHLCLAQSDPNEAAWISEGASQLVEVLAGYEAPKAAVAAFAALPDVQLNAWSTAPGDQYRHYGAAFLALEYLYERYGLPGIQSLLASPEDGTSALAQALLQLDGTALHTFYDDWSIANLLDDPTLGAGRYGYRGIDLSLAPQRQVSSYPAAVTLGMVPYAAQYVELLPIPDEATDLTLRVIGPRETRLFAAEAPEGHPVWWSNRADSGHSWLQRELDLSDTEQAELSFRLWYDIETGWDWAGVRVSPDGGESWSWLEGRHMVHSAAGSGAPAVVYTGRSGATEPDAEPRWVAETLDLTPYAGQSVTVRIDMFTDEAQTGPGLCLDDLAVHAIGWKDTPGDGGWTTAGFVRTDGVVPVTWSAQLVTYRGSVAHVERIPLEAGQGSWTLKGLGREVNRAVVVVSALTDPRGPLSTEPMPVRLTIEPAT